MTEWNMKSPGTRLALLDALRVPLVIGVSVVALSASATLLFSGAANAQTNPPFVVGDAYKWPYAVDLSQVTIPGVSLSTTPQVLETNNAASTPVALTVTNALNPNGSPVVQSYSAYEAANGGAANYANGTGANITNVLVDSSGHAVSLANATAAGIDLSGATSLPGGYSWAPLTAQDTADHGAALYKWVSATYSNDTAIAGVAAAPSPVNTVTYQHDAAIAGVAAAPTATGAAASTNASTSYLLTSGGAPVSLASFNTWYGGLTLPQQTALNAAYLGGVAAYNAELATLGATFRAVDGTATEVIGSTPSSGSSGKYLLTSTGAPVSAVAFNNWVQTLTPAQQTALQNAYASGSITAYNAELAALGATWHAVSGTASDPALTASTNYTFQKVTSTDSKTTAVAGGAVFSNATTGQYQASGPGGTVIYDPNGVSAGNYAQTVATAGKTVLSSGQGSITLDATVDPAIIVTNGTAAGTTVIHNGDIFAGTSVNAPTVNATTVNATTVNAGALAVTGLSTTTGIVNTGDIKTTTLHVTGLSTTTGINNTGALNQNGVATFTNGAAANGTTTVTGGLVKVTSPQALDPAAPLGATAGIILNGNVDPLLTVTNGTAAGTTTINNGVLTAGTSLNAPTVNADTGNITTVNSTNVNTTNALIGNAAVTNSLTVSNGANINMGDNVVHGVADPIIGTDAANKRYVDRGLNKAYDGTAIALALSQPIFAPGQTWAVRAGWGGYEGENAGGVTVAGIIGRDWFGGGSTVAIDGGIGFSSNEVAGKAGVTIGFGGGYIPMK